MTRARAGPAPRGSRLRRRALQAAPWVLAILVLGLIGRQAATMDWPEVWRALREQSPQRIALAVALGLVSHALYSSFDLVSRRLLKHGLPAARTALTAATSYAFNLNFGALVGGMALRLRMYTRLGLEAAVAGQVIAWSLVTNWLGYALVGGVVLVAATPPVPESWPVSRGALRIAGAVIGAIGIGWLLACALSRRRELRWREHRLELPPLRIALLQAALSSANWLLIGAIVWLLIGGRVDYPTTLAVLQLAAVAGVLTHVPAGLGVLEAVFLAALGHRVPPAQLLAALLAYRATYYLLPLAWAVPFYLAGEARARRDPTNGARRGTLPTGDRDAHRRGNRICVPRKGLFRGW